MSGRPPGLKVYPGLLEPRDTARLLALCRELPPPPKNPLFRYFGALGEDAEPYALRLDAGDAYVIRATARWQWEHRVMPVGHQRGGGESFVMASKRG